jgi:hypothetical protein
MALGPYPRGPTTTVTIQMASEFTTFQVAYSLLNIDDDQDRAKS